MSVQKLDTPLISHLRSEEKLKARIKQECENLASSPCKVATRYDPDWGYVYEVKVDAGARKALEANLKLQEKFPGVPIVVEWTG
uniref:Uncharacterized protein n=1 Tax=Thermofilum adornatum TaxID=1365176 RepID=A0A7C1GCM1_9CREN